MSRLRALAIALLPGLVAAAALGAVGGAAVIAGGLFDVQASTQHSAPVAWALHTTMIQADRRHAAAIEPPPITPQAVQTGLALYDRDCVSCHGGPATPRADWVNGMNPSPPFLIDVARRWTRPQMFWIVKNGVKMTGMPAWGVTRSDDQIWSVVDFLEAMPDLTPSTYAAMRADGARQIKVATPK
jgi:mono/diheme cytochrome c family protein